MATLGAMEAVGAQIDWQGIINSTVKNHSIIQQAEAEAEARVEKYANMFKRNPGYTEYGKKKLEEHYNQLTVQLGEIQRKNPKYYQDVDDMIKVNEISSQFLNNPILEEEKKAQENLKLLEESYNAGEIDDVEYENQLQEYARYAKEGGSFRFHKPITIDINDIVSKMADLYGTPEMNELDVTPKNGFSKITQSSTINDERLLLSIASQLSGDEMLSRQAKKSFNALPSDVQERHSNNYINWLKELTKQKIVINNSKIYKNSSSGGGGGGGKTDYDATVAMASELYQNELDILNSGKKSVSFKSQIPASNTSGKVTPGNSIMNAGIKYFVEDGNGGFKEIKLDDNIKKKYVSYSYTIKDKNDGLLYSKIKISFDSTDNMAELGDDIKYFSKRSENLTGLDPSMQQFVGMMQAFNPDVDVYSGDVFVMNDLDMQRWSEDNFDLGQSVNPAWVKHYYENRIGNEKSASFQSFENQYNVQNSGMFDNEKQTGFSPIR